MGTLLSLPAYYKNPSASAASWPGTSTSVNFSKTSRSHLGSVSTDNGKTLGSSIDTGSSNNLYTHDEGFYANVQTKTSTVFYSLHFIGHKNNNTISKGSSISTTTQSTWARDVIGFHCEIDSRPGGSGSEADGCGRVDQWRICGVYADTSNKCRIMEMTQGGQKLSSHAYNSYPGTGAWKKLSYSLNQSDSLTVVNNKWLLYGWIIEYRHKKTCGGSSKQKNCSGRTRYLRPIISPTGYNGLKTSYDHSMLIYHWETTLSTARSSGAKMLQSV